MSPLLEKAINQLKQLPEAEQMRIASLILNNLNSQRLKKVATTKDSNAKLSEVLLLPELEEGEWELRNKRQKDNTSI